MQNFRSFADMTVELGDLTILIGANGTGKTTVLDALALFASTRPDVQEEDYHKGADRIDITLTIEPGGHAVPERFVRDGLVRLRRSFSRDGEGGIMAEARRNKYFDAARAADGAEALKEEAKEIRKRYACVPPYKNRRQFLESLDECEAKLSKDPGHSGAYYTGYAEYPNWKEGIAGLLTVIHVPAMKEIADEGEEGTGGLLKDLMDMAVRGAEKSDKALANISRALGDEYAKYNEAVRGLLEEIGEDLGRSSEEYMDGARFRVTLDDPRATVSHPRASVHMSDGEFMATVGRAGSGFQRVYLFSLLDTIANRRQSAALRAGSGNGAPVPLRLIAIDEPELYQHPQRQRRILKSFIETATGGLPISIVCSTHSPYFVELQKVDKLRLLQKGKNRGVRSITAAELDGLDERLRGDSSWLDMNATHWITEGFFARRAVVVEGASDRNTLLAAARALSDADPDKSETGMATGPTPPWRPSLPDTDLNKSETSIVPAGGVENMDIIAKLFVKFGIPVYMVWDLDCRGGRCKKGIRDRNARLVSIASGGWRRRVPKKTAVRAEFACFEANLTETLSGELQDCGRLLEGLEEYGLLEDAVRQDGQATHGTGRKRCPFCECWDRARAGDGKQKPVIRSQKRVLKSKLNVYRMLMRIGEKNHQVLEGLTVTKIVRRLEKTGAGGKRRARRSGIRGLGSADRRRPPPSDGSAPPARPHLRRPSATCG